MRRTALLIGTGLLVASTGVSQVPVGPPPPGGALLPLSAQPVPEDPAPRFAVPPGAVPQVPGGIPLARDPVAPTPHQVPIPSPNVPPVPARPPEPTVEQLIEA